MSKKKILILNGPNLNLLGTREPDIYGNTTFESFLEQVRSQFSTADIEYYQSNIEGELINKLHDTENEEYSGIVLNAGGYSHTAVALADAVAAIKTPVVGVHISNIYTRENERHTELLAQYCVGGIYGLGIKGYDIAIEYLISH
ncbi:MAG: 3-dehydroquinate dehydratase-2 [Bacteroidia bacterium]|jgi:3-dehydroquinate dehydratase-2|tara:strand:+ start:1227 stop:1658 length:432 start_codon:yes stop_codon:yes gene_type:complete